ncbi:MAG TPA: acyl-CoA desaturase [Bacteroidia bacterium]|nr:acyl-CoA desaturase [Bacteroidia bacterium]
MIIIIFLILHWYLSLFAQTFFLHRYGAHKMFSMSKGWERVFYLFTWVTQGSSFLNPRAYAIMHRMHHAYSDTEKDPHSPHFFKEVFSMMWFTKNMYNGLVTGELPAEQKFDKNYPAWRWVDKFAESDISRYFFVALYVLFYILFATQWWMFLFLPIHFLMGPIQGAVVNWAGHKYGYSNYNDGDLSRNTFFFDFLMLGELFQNNHHHFAARSNFANKWWEFDPVYPVIFLLDKMRVIRLARA